MFGTSNFGTLVTSVPTCGLRHQMLTSAPISIEMLTSAPWKSGVPKLMTCADVHIWCWSSCAEVRLPGYGCQFFGKYLCGVIHEHFVSIRSAHYYMVLTFWSHFVKLNCLRSPKFGESSYRRCWIHDFLRSSEFYYIGSFSRQRHIKLSPKTRSWCMTSVSYPGIQDLFDDVTCVLQPTRWCMTLVMTNFVLKIGE